jgi:hypothetical protein
LRGSYAIDQADWFTRCRWRNAGGRDLDVASVSGVGKAGLQCRTHIQFGPRAVLGKLAVNRGDTGVATKHEVGVPSEGVKHDAGRLGHGDGEVHVRSIRVLLDADISNQTHLNNAPPSASRRHARVEDAIEHGKHIAHLQAMIRWFGWLIDAGSVYERALSSWRGGTHRAAPTPIVEG